MKTIARLTTRLQGEGDGLMLGVALKGHNFFEPNSVYEIVEVLGTHVIRKVGQGTPGGEGETVMDSPIRQHWAMDVGDLLGLAGANLFVTRAEMIEYQQAQRGDKG